MSGVEHQRHRGGVGEGTEVGGGDEGHGGEAREDGGEGEEGLSVGHT